jgi:hypothetical protein
MKIMSQKKRKQIKTRKIKKYKINKKQTGGKSEKNKLKKLQCSPKEKNKMNKFSCYTDETLIKLRDLWNERHPDNQIKTNKTQEIHKKLANNLSNVCNKESCWLKQKFTQHKLDEQFSDSFAPESPDEWKENPNEWLTSSDIINVMKQYEKAYKCFDFIGPSPIDFDTKKMFGECVWEELCNFNLAEQIKNGKTKIGMIFNTHPHTKPGEHWLSMFINIKKGKIFFFDSVGYKIPDKIMILVNRIIEQGNNLNPKINFIFDQNYPVEHQYENTECGMYSLYFIIHMLEDKITEHYLKTHILKDEYIEKFRKIYFNDDL